ncbi:uncharacterized protein BT62DRAFT_977806 [Guyanagaster necrorhizus]|uniref:Uncharacterized protein n=1 Tax=Guyanagaster necrorhizus TaxID=856835 RepID=A0A9P7W6K4_9AGAR|nr:uncharacterized protein BT62DRAFT_977806 [Guyanagaster necrorhizus MCA 3950]KAG7452186.1 hypothetical protein BT62DRAFT_977806 [Guyanagaster necrorhizus MCA 3950]
MSTCLPKDAPSSDRDNLADDKDNDASLSEESAGQGKIPPLGAPVDDTPTGIWKCLGRRRVAHDWDAFATQPSVFDDPATLDAYRPPPRYEKSSPFYLNLTTNDCNLEDTLFRLSSLIAGLRASIKFPSQLVFKRVGPNVWVPYQMVLWSNVAFSQCWLLGRASFLATRSGVFIPDIVLYLSYFYTKTELPIKLAFFWVSNYLSVIISAFLATGILQLRQTGGKAEWRYLFLIEGLTTLGCGLFSFSSMPPGPTQTKAWFLRKGWFTERVLRDDSSESDNIFKALQDWRMWPLYALGLTHMMLVDPHQTYLTLSFRNLGFDTMESNLLSIPSTIIGVIMLLFTSFLSEPINSGVIATVVLHVYFIIITFIIGFPDVHLIQVAWASRNSYCVKARTISASIYSMFFQAGTIVYVSYERCKRGNRALIGIRCMNIFFYRFLNARRDKTWNSWTKEEQQIYADTTTDQSHARLDFRFTH